MSKEGQQTFAVPLRVSPVPLETPTIMSSLTQTGGNTLNYIHRGTSGTQMWTN